MTSPLYHMSHCSKLHITQCRSVCLICLQAQTLSQGTVLGVSRDDDTTPAIDGTSGSLDAEAIEDSDREKRGVDGLIDKVNGMLGNLYQII